MNRTYIENDYEDEDVMNSNSHINSKYDEDDDEDFDVHVGISTANEDEILVYDNCGRFVPVDSMDIDDLILKLMSFKDYFNIKYNLDHSQEVSPSKLMRKYDEISKSVNKKLKKDCNGNRCCSAHTAQKTCSSSS